MLRKFKFLLDFARIMNTLLEDQCTLMIISRLVFSKNEKYFRKNVVKKTKHILGSIIPPRKLCMVEPDRLQMTKEYGTCTLNAG